MLLLTALYLLVRSYKALDRMQDFARYVILFYGVAFALIASNNLLAHSFIVAISAALVMGVVLAKWNPALPHSRLLNARLQFATLLCLGLVYLFTFYLYPPAQQQFRVLEHIWDRTAALLLDVQSEKVNSYQQVVAGWVNLKVYFLISSADWLLLLASILVWSRQTWRWIIRRRQPPSTASWLLWLLYTAFAIQGAASILVDRAGALGSNLQHRVFPSFSTLGVGLVVGALISAPPRVPRRWLRLAVVLGLLIMQVFAVLKASNEPLISNTWTFYTAAELSGLQWANAHLRAAEVCNDVSERLAAALLTSAAPLSNGNSFPPYQVATAQCNILVTDVTSLRARRLGITIPIPADGYRVYDSGAVQLYHPQPRTPYQP